MRKPLFIIALLAILTAAAGTYTLVDLFIEPQSPRAPASAPDNYETLGACAKQDILWQKVLDTAYDELPEHRKFGVMQLMAMSKQEIRIKGSHHSDFAPAGWTKYLHGRGVLAKVKIVAKKNKYTGIFQGADCALLRLSLTYQTSASRPVAPGLALKVLRDGVYSANVSALVSLDGQGHDFNFFKYPMSNIVPVGEDIGQKLVHRIFNKATHYPEELLAQDLATVDAHGVKAAAVVAPRQIFFVPNGTLGFAAKEHDVRGDILSIPQDTTIYQVYLVSDKYAKLNYANYKLKDAVKFLNEAEHVADIVTTSKFVASKFSDDGIFFRHQLRP